MIRLIEANRCNPRIGAVDPPQHRHKLLNFRHGRRHDEAGARLTGLSLDALSDHLLDLIIDTASGKPTRSETHGEREIALWKDGATL